MRRLYSSLKAMRYPEHLAAMIADCPAPPVHVRIKPTNVCNHSCYFCAYRSSAVSLGEDMNVRDRIPRAKMLEIADDLVAMGVKAVTFSGGGEPLIYPYLVETMERLAAGRVSLGALTNGAQLRGKVADAFADWGTWIRVSIDGWDGPSYARYRDVRESEYAKVMGNLSAFAARNSRCELGASIIVDATNAGRVTSLAAQLKDAGVRQVKVSACVVSNDAAKNAAYHQPISAIVREQIEQMNRLEDGAFVVHDHYHTLGSRFGTKHVSCSMARLLTVIGADSVVYTCQDKAYTASGTLGSIADRRFADFWFSDENWARLRALNPARDCRHHCVAETKNELLQELIEIDPNHAAFV